ncbi:molybdate ABC transporter substrate-binding protein, partial [Candidatus Riflebacteria bacterium]
MSCYKYTDFFLNPVFFSLIIFFLNFSSVHALELLTVFAAASTRQPVEKLLKRFKEKTGIESQTSFASSGTLARQISFGAEVDIFLSANCKWAEYLIQEKIIQSGSKLDYLKNSLILVKPVNISVRKIELKKSYPIADSFNGLISIADPMHAPAGQYAQQALKSLGWWSKLKGRMCFAIDVRSALAFVVREETELGIIYKTDLKFSQN